MEPMLASGSWVRPEPLSIIGFALMFVLFTLGGLAIWHHRRIFIRGPMATVLFLIAIGYGFAVSLWVVDQLRIYHPYTSEPNSVQQAERPIITEKAFPTENPHRDASPQD